MIDEWLSDFSGKKTTSWAYLVTSGLNDIFLFFLSNDLRILQITYMTNKNITKTTIWKTKQHKHWTLCAIIKSNNVIKTKEM